MDNEKRTWYFGTSREDNSNGLGLRNPNKSGFNICGLTIKKVKDTDKVKDSMEYCRKNLI